MTPDQEAMLLATAFEGIAKIIESVKAARSGKVDPAKVLDQISMLHQSLADNNSEIDAEAKAKFGP